MTRLNVEDIMTIRIDILTTFCQLYKNCQERNQKYTSILSNINEIKKIQNNIQKQIDKNIIESIELQNEISNIQKLKQLNLNYKKLEKQNTLLSDDLLQTEDKKKQYEISFISLYNELKNEEKIDEYYNIVNSIIDAYDIINETLNKYENKGVINKLKQKITVKKILSKMQKNQIDKKIDIFNRNINNINNINNKYNDKFTSIYFELDNPIEITKPTPPKTRQQKIMELELEKQKLLPHNKTTKTKSVA